jgi:SAM-dependent methyltransferase
MLAGTWSQSANQRDDITTMAAFLTSTATALNGSPRTQCPVCRQPLDLDISGDRCSRCLRVFLRTARGQRDLRLPPGQAVTYQLSYESRPYDRTIEVPLKLEGPCPERRNHLRSRVPRHLTADQISYIPQAVAGDVALDLGCGRGIHREVIETLGYQYHGVDFAGEAADDLVDAHALPYCDDEFALVLAVAVLEHLARPLLALREVYRVLRPRSYFVGTVAFLEPFHDNSFFHFTHLGVGHALRCAGFAVETIMPIRGWHVARAQLEMGLGARLPRWLTRLLTEPVALAIESYALLGRLRASDPTRHQRTSALARHAGAFFFVANKAMAERRDV